MTVEVDTAGPGIETYRSGFFAVSVNGTAAYTYSRTRTAIGTNLAWTANDSVELSVATWGSDETVEVLIAAFDGGGVNEAPIESFVIYPENVAVQAGITGGQILMTVPANERLYVAINGDLANVLLIHAKPLKATAPDPADDWTDLALTVSSVNEAANEITFTAAHGLSGGERVVFNLQAGGGALPGGIDQYTTYIAAVVDTDTISLTDSEGDTVDITSAGTGPIYANVAEHTDDARGLYFPAGRHVIGREFGLADDVTVYLEAGAVVVGSFRLVDLDGVTITGPGLISPEYATYEELVDLPWVERVKYAVFNGYGGSSSFADNVVDGIVVLGAPFFLCTGGIWSWRNVTSVSPWTPNTDGFICSPRNNTTYAMEVVDCLAFQGDDNLHFNVWGPNRAFTSTGCFLINSMGACLHGGYWPPPSAQDGTTISITDVDIVHFEDDTTADPTASGHVLRAWSDGWPDQSELGTQNVTVNGRVWGEIGCIPISLRNHAYPWGDDVRLQYGQIHTWDVTLWFQQESDELSEILGRDATNTPHDITFDLTFAGTQVTADNYTSYFTVNAYPYNISWEEDEVTIPPSTDPAFVVEDGTGLSTANSYSTVDAATSYLALVGGVAEWTSATDAERKTALRVATYYLDEVYGGRWLGGISTTEQALDWPRSGAYDRNGRLLSSTAIPRAIQEATCEVAVRYLQGVSLRPDLEPGESRIGQTTITAGPVSISDSFGGSRETQPEFPIVQQKLRSLLRGGGSRALVGVTR